MKKSPTKFANVGFFLYLCGALCVRRCVAHVGETKNGNKIKQYQYGIQVCTDVSARQGRD